MANRRAISESRVLELAAEVEATGGNVSAVARRAGVKQWTLARWLRGVVTRHKARAGKGTTLAYHATCGRCGEEIRASQLGLESDAAWQRWVSLACRHAGERHGIRDDAALRWAHDTWYVRGEREVSNRDGSG